MPEEVDVGGHTFVFSDGAVTTLNNPALQLFLMATLPAYHLGWPTGRDELLLVSVGTGTTERLQADLRAEDLNLLSYATQVPEALIHSARRAERRTCAGSSASAGPGRGSTASSATWSAAPGCSPSRCSATSGTTRETHPASLEQLGVGHLSAERLDRIDGVEFIEEMCEFGRAVSAQVDPAHFEGFV